MSLFSMWKYSLSLPWLCVASTFVSAEMIDTVTSVPPSLITTPLIHTTPELLKRGLWGTSSFEVGIDSTGFVDSCTITSSGNRAFDSLVKCKIAAGRFAPAIVNGRAASSILKGEIVVPCDSLVEYCLDLPPNFVGTVVDTVLGISLPKTRILLHYPDTTEDSTLTIGFGRYLSLIGNGAAQRYNGLLLITETDSLGNFAFRLLPRGHFTMSVQSAGYEVYHFRGCIAGDKPLQCRYILRQTQVRSFDNTDVITVYGQRSLAEKSITIAEEEKRTGFSPYLSTVVQAKAEIRRVPEGPSLMLVRSGCPYDNVYVIAGVPMLAPFHFGGYPYADIDGLMISALSSVKVTINDVAAKRIDASGCIVEAEPGKIKYDNGCAEKGFYLKGDISMLGMDFLAAYSSKKRTGDFVQVGYTACDDYMLKYNKSFYFSVNKGNYGIGVPISYGNATLAGSKSVGSLRCTAFGWLAWDSYNILAGDSVFPWGTGSIKLAFDSSNRSLTIGGAHQFFGTGKQVDTTIFSSRSFLNNIEVTADFDTIIRRPLVATIAFRFSNDEWNGFLLEQGNDRADLLQYVNNPSVFLQHVYERIHTPLRVHGSETRAQLNTSLIKQAGNITAELDLLASAIRYTGSTQHIGDVGTSILYDNDHYHAGIHFGRVTSRPDVRGLPDSLFRMQLNRTYIGSLPFFVRYGIISRFGIEPYFRYCTNAPQLDPVRHVWNKNNSTPVVAHGADFECRIMPTSWAEMSAALNLANTRRQNANGDFLSYEWNLPWTIRTSLHLHSKNDRFHLYLDYIRTKGLPYYDLENQAYAPLPVYRSIDLNFQIRTFMPQQRHINKLDCYITLKNAQDLFRISNVRDYYWDINGHRQPIYLGYGRIDIGVRFGIRL